MGRAVPDDRATSCERYLDRPVKVVPISSLSLSPLGGLRHCSQAEAIDAAAAQISAQRPIDDIRAMIQKASLVSAKTASHRFLPVRNGP
jgi:hypothetical protein